jgi:hypothetical protein
MCQESVKDSWGSQRVHSYMLSIYRLLVNRTLEADRKFSTIRQGWSKGMGGGDACMKLYASSSGCKARPAQGEPAQAGSEPGDGLSNGVGEERDVSGGGFAHGTHAEDDPGLALDKRVKRQDSMRQRTANVT